MSNILADIDNKLAEECFNHIRCRVSMTKDVCYPGKVIKIIATNFQKDEPAVDIEIDSRYSRESLTFIIPLQNHDTIQALNDYINWQVYLAIQKINTVLV